MNYRDVLLGPGHPETRYRAGAKRGKGRHLSRPRRIADLTSDRMPTLDLELDRIRDLRTVIHEAPRVHRVYRHGDVIDRGRGLIHRIDPLGNDVMPLVVMLRG